MGCLRIEAFLLFSAFLVLAPLCLAQEQSTLEDNVSSVESAAPSAAPIIKAVPSSARKPFLALRNPATAASKEIQRLYEQGSSASTIAYLLFAAAEPLSTADGTPPALLSYLSPTILRLFSSLPERCSTDLVAILYDLSSRLHGTEALQACHYDLYNALHATFAWLHDHSTLRQQPQQQQLDGAEDASPATWPYLDLSSGTDFTAAVLAALSDAARLADTAAAVEDACGMDRSAFAAVAYPVAGVLQDLNADLALLQLLAEQLHSTQWTTDGDGDSHVSDSSGSVDSGGNRLGSVGMVSARLLLSEGRGAPRRVVAARTSGDQRRHTAGWGGSAATTTSDQRVTGGAGGASGDVFAEVGGGAVSALFADEAAAAMAAAPAPAVATAAGATGRLLEDEHRKGHVSSSSPWYGVQRRRQLSDGVPDNYFYGMPPSTFVVASPGSMPQLLIPLVFHIMLYSDRDGSVAPANYDQAASYVARMVRVANYMAKPANVQFFVKEVRNNAATYPYLLLADRTAWLTCPIGGASGTSCLLNDTFASSTIADFPRSVNVYVASDATAGVSVPLGYAWVPGSDVFSNEGYVFLTWDSLSTSGSNSLSAYNDGPNTLVHEIFHHLGVRHTFAPVSSPLGCNNDDYVIDTPATLGYASITSFASTSTAYCMELFWGQYGGDWDAAYSRWSTTLGIPDTDMNAWADSCPARAGYDELGNYMTYNTAVCFAALGHFTPGQAQRAHYITSELNPVLYAWAQYYARTSAPPPAALSPPPEAYNNTCRATRGNCPCKASWMLNGNAYSYCDRIGNNNTLFCEVQNPTTCAVCNTADPNAKCVASCSGTARICKRPPAPGTNMPPPPPPRPPSPPPMPPPPPPLAVPSACKQSASGCACRSTWIFNNNFFSYCAAPDGGNALWCQVDASCPTFNVQDPYMNCAPELTPENCRADPVRLSTTSALPPSSPIRPPTPPSPPPPRPSPPLPPAPSVGAIASVTGSLVVNANCSALRPNATVAIPDLVSELATISKVASGFITITSVNCSAANPQLLVANFTVYFPSTMTATQISSVALLLSSTAAMKAALSSTFQSKWGGVSQTSNADTVILQRLQVISEGPFYVLRLASGDSGLVEVMLPDGGLGLICGSSGFNMSEASVVCQQLGFSSGLPVLPVSVSNPAAYQASLFMTGLSCDLKVDASLELCDSSGWVASSSTCNISTVAGVKCLGNVVAIVDASLTINATDCSGASVASSLMLSELFAALADQLYNVPDSRMQVTRRPSCRLLSGGGAVLLLVPYSVMIPSRTPAASVDAAEDAGSNLTAVRASLGATFQSRWGPVTAVGNANVTVVDRAEICLTPVDAATRTCIGDGPAPSPTPFLDQKVPNTSLTVKSAIIIGSCIVAFLLLLIVVLVLVKRSRRDSQVKPDEQQSSAAPGDPDAAAAPGPATNNNWVAGAAVPEASGAGGTVAVRPVGRGQAAPDPRQGNGVTQIGDAEIEEEIDGGDGLQPMGFVPTSGAGDGAAGNRGAARGGGGSRIDSSSNARQSRPALQPASAGLSPSPGLLTPAGGPSGETLRLDRSTPAPPPALPPSFSVSGQGPLEGTPGRPSDRRLYDPGAVDDGNRRISETNGPLDNDPLEAVSAMPNRLAPIPGMRESGTYGQMELRHGSPWPQRPSTVGTTREVPTLTSVSSEAPEPQRPSTVGTTPDVTSLTPIANGPLAPRAAEQQGPPGHQGSQRISGTTLGSGNEGRGSETAMPETTAEEVTPASGRPSGAGGIVNGRESAGVVVGPSARGNVGSGALVAAGDGGWGAASGGVLGANSATPLRPRRMLLDPLSPGNTAVGPAAASVRDEPALTGLNTPH